MVWLIPSLPSLGVAYALPLLLNDDQERNGSAPQSPHIPRYLPDPKQDTAACTSWERNTPHPQFFCTSPTPGVLF